ncbi:integrase [Streptomyces sp. NBC_01549]|uniref:integrase n=1 Tax=Streptomyces sp. NBC_01549 TaxID=2975874 RepID=UPI00225B83E0|nr:integrase [Streptomyces sp. NBC_01549]MCX4591710.1 integrase [Streptomyces sp. NBC_01549]
MMHRPAPAYPYPLRTVSVFAGADVCDVAGLRLAPGAERPLFEYDRWVLSGLLDAHRMMSDHEHIWDFAEIINPSWRVVAKEVLLALLAPQHESVLQCALAIRSVRSPRTCFRFLQRLTEWFNWLTRQGVTRLEDVPQEMCEYYLEERSWSVPVPGKPRRRLEPKTTHEIVRVMQLLALYGELLSTDRYAARFAPWEGMTSAQVVGRLSDEGNRTHPVPDSLLQPLLATCIYLVDVIGPHLADLLDEVRADTAVAQTLPNLTLDRLPELRQVIEEMRASGEPLPAIAQNQAVRRALRCGDGPLSELSWSSLAHKIGAHRFSDAAYHAVTPLLEEVAGEMGFQEPWARQAAPVARLDDGALVPWTGPVAVDDIRILTDYVVTACLVLTCALSGMRTSELLEIETGCRHSAATPGGGRRFRLAGRLIKNQKFGGVPDEWVVIEQVDRAVALAERLTSRPKGEALFGSIGLTDRVTNLRNWLERTGYQEHWGLPKIPNGPSNARMLRRTLALSIAERPGGLLAAKVGLKHISVATTEGYAARPGGSQRLFHSEMRQAEEAHHVRLTVEAFREVQAGIMPAGPGARGLIDAFRHVDAELKDAARTDPKVLQDDRHLESLLRKQAKTLHVGPANFCWFRDPSKALCLRLAGTPGAKRPLVGMCDSARCPQATHHRRHRSVWLGQIATIETFVESPRVAKGEKMRLIPERDRAQRVVAEIDAAAPAARVGED